MSFVKSFVSQVNSSRQGVYLVKGTDAGHSAWYYVQVDKQKLPIFLKKCEEETKQLELTFYGVILESGWGEEPPIYLKRQYEDKPLNNIHFLQTNDAQGKEYYVYLEVNPDKEEELERVTKIGGFKMQDYGKIIAYDWGYPTEEVIQYMREQYNIETPLPTEA